MTANDNYPTVSYCCTPEIGTKVFAYFNLILSSLTCMAGLTLLVVLLIETFSYVYTSTELQFYILQAVAAFTIVFFSSIGVVFGAFLLAGALKKKADYLQAYYVYGVVVLSLSTVGLLAVIFAMSKEDVPYVMILFAGYAVYALILGMIKKTILLYRNLTNQYQHQILNEKA